MDWLVRILFKYNISSPHWQCLLHKKDQELGHRNREDIVHQLYASERAYIESLNLLLNVFLNPLRKDAKQSSFKLLGMKKMICTEREIRWLFGNIDEIIQTQRDILASLEER